MKVTKISSTVWGGIEIDLTQKTATDWYETHALLLWHFSSRAKEETDGQILKALSNRVGFHASCLDLIAPLASNDASHLTRLYASMLGRPINPVNVVSDHTKLRLGF